MDQCNICMTANTAGNENDPFHTENHGLRLTCNSLSSCFTLGCLQTNVKQLKVNARRSPEAINPSPSIHLLLEILPTKILNSIRSAMVAESNTQ